MSYLKQSLEDFSQSQGNISTGILTGGVISINGGDAAKFDVTEGTGVIVDWTDPSNPSVTNVSWSGSVANVVTNIATEGFTTIYIDAAGDLQQQNTLISATDRRSRIILNTISHIAMTNIETVSTSFRPAYNLEQALFDYIQAQGLINSGNIVSAASTNLTVAKSVGESTFPFINHEVDSQNPSITTDPSQASISELVKIYQDGVGDFTFATGSANVDPDQYDDGSGTLAAVGNNEWTVQRLYFFTHIQQIILVYGQATYGSLAAAEAAIFSESPVIDPDFSRGVFTTALCVKKGATNLSDVSSAKFVQIILSNTGDALPVTPITHHFSIQVADSATSVATGDGVNGICISSLMDGFEISDVSFVVATKGITGTTDVVLRKSSAGVDSDVLSTPITLGDEFFAGDGVLDVSEIVVSEGDLLFPDVDVVHSGTAPLGGWLCITLTEA